MHLTKIKNRLLVWMTLILILAGCSSNVVFEDYVTIPENGWNKDSMATFNVNITNIENYNDLFINIRNKSDYSNSNIWLFVDVTSPSGKTVRDTLNCYLADEHGKWLGSGWGDLFLVKCPYKMNVKFAEPGEYKFNIIQGMRYDELEGIHNIGITVFRSNK